MTKRPTKIERPQRWDKPFEPAMNQAVVDLVLSREPFASMDPAAFSRKVSLAGIIEHDCRLLDLERGDIIVREGDYGSSAFLILDGTALVSLKSLPSNLLGRNSEPAKRNWLDLIGAAWSRSPYAETRDVGEQQFSDELVGRRDKGGETQVFLHDVPRVIGPDASVSLHVGEIFGEISALTRSPRSATVVANSKMQLLEIRWQGFRELLQRDAAMKDHVERLYRQNSLLSHLRELPIMKSLSEQAMEAICEATEFRSYGDFQWNQEFKSTAKQDIAARIQAEPVIAEEGQSANDLFLIRSGFARLSRKHGDGHKTIAYLGKGQVFGLRELLHNAKTNEDRPWALSLRAVGYVDVLTIPAEVVHTVLLSGIPDNLMPAPLPKRTTAADAKAAGVPNGNRRLETRKKSVDTPLLEFLVGNRMVNGSNAMVIDLNRCTRCDDCVRACASTHDNNPRFNRSGPVHDNWMVAHACMHCLDPVCMIGCPTGAIHRESETGTVKINDSTCIGCSTCSNSCPYSNIQMVEINDRKGLPIIDSASGDPIRKATKCDLCQDHGGGPACQRACPHDALVRIDLSTPGPFSQLQ